MTIDILRVLGGEVIDTADLKLAKAVSFANFVTRNPEAGVTTIEARRSQTAESLVIDIRAAVGQKPANDIRRVERLLISFEKEDRDWPRIFSLRPDFPTNVPHLNVPWFGFPPSLCVSELSYDEEKLTWSPPKYVGLIRNWLERTATGNLHQQDQDLEPFFLHNFGTLIVPHEWFSKAPPAGQRFIVVPIAEGSYRLQTDDGSHQELRNASLILLTLPPREQRGIPVVPQTLAELSRLITSDDFDFKARLRDQLLALRNAGTLETVPTMLLQVPLVRTAGDTPEQYDVHAFAFIATLREVGASLDIWDPNLPLGHIMAPDPSRDGSDIKICALRVQATLTADDAAAYNGSELPSAQYVAVGAGALGSQVLLGLTRSGWSPRTIMDCDMLLPHNLARHALLGDSIGRNKAEALATVFKATVDGIMVNAIDANVARPDDKADTVLSGDVDALLEISASVAVARRLAVDVRGRARRASLFLNPSGTDLVFFIEDRDRLARLDHLELQYYWYIVEHDGLGAHFRNAANKRYGGGCRDVSAKIRQTSLMIHAGIGAAAFRALVGTPAATAHLWQLDESSGTVRRLDLDSRPMRQGNVSGWSVLLSESFLSAIASVRASVLPNETGGVLIGTADLQRKLLYIVGIVPAPPDSKSWLAGYIRGVVGLKERIDQIDELSGGNLGYLGEWHSHPDGYSSDPSGDDKKAYAWLADAFIDEGRPPVMVIASQTDVRVIIDGGECAIPFTA